MLESVEDESRWPRRAHSRDQLFYGTALCASIERFEIVVNSASIGKRNIGLIEYELEDWSKGNQHIDLKRCLVARYNKSAREGYRGRWGKACSLDQRILTERGGVGGSLSGWDKAGNDCEEGHCGKRRRWSIVESRRKSNVQLRGS